MRVRLTLRKARATKNTKKFWIWVSRWMNRWIRVSEISRNYPWNGLAYAHVYPLGVSCRVVARFYVSLLKNKVCCTSKSANSRMRLRPYSDGRYELARINIEFLVYSCCLFMDVVEKFPHGAINAFCCHNEKLHMRLTHNPSLLNYSYSTPSSQYICVCVCVVY